MASLPLGTIPKDLKDLTSEWMTAVLYQSGTLLNGRVVSVAPVIGEKWHIAQTACVSVRFSKDAYPVLPDRFFIKLAVFDDPFEVILPGENAFYRRGHTADLPVPYCYAALFDPESRLSCLIVQDLSETHETTPWPHQLTEARCFVAVEALARFHADNWFRPGFEDGPTVEQLIDNEFIMRSEFQKLLPGFLDALANELSESRKNLFIRALQTFPDLKAARLEEGRPTTLVHGDAHAWNVMFPKRQPSPDSCIFVDWEDWRFDAGVADIAYMIAVSWYPERRERLEKPLLSHYHDTLMRNAVTHYSRDDLMLDYRIALIQHVVVPLYLQQFQPGDIYWVEQLERWFTSMKELDCEDLL